MGFGVSRSWKDTVTGTLWWGATQFTIAPGVTYGVRYTICWYPSFYSPQYSHAYAFTYTTCS